MKKIIIIFVLVLFSCSENKKDVNTNADNGGTNANNDGMNPDNDGMNANNDGMNPNNDGMNPDNGGMPTMRDRVGKLHYAASTPCQAGDYSIYPNGLKSVTIECDHDGKLSKQTVFHGVGSVKNYNTLSKSAELLYRADGSRERSTAFYENGNKIFESLYRADGTQRKYQSFDIDGMASSTTYYMADGDTACSPRSTKCVDSDPE